MASDPETQKKSLSPGRCDTGISSRTVRLHTINGVCSEVEKDAGFRVPFQIYPVTAETRAIQREPNGWTPE